MPLLPSCMSSHTTFGDASAGGIPEEAPEASPDMLISIVIMKFKSISFENVKKNKVSNYFVEIATFQEVF